MSELATATKIRKVMVLDDEAELAELVSVILSDFNCECQVFSDPRKALAFYAETWAEIDIVMVDMVMPKMSGGAVLRELKKYNPNVKAYLLSGYAGDCADIQALLAEGFAGFIAKPFRDTELAAILE